MDESELAAAERIATILGLEPGWEALGTLVGNGQVAQCRHWEFLTGARRLSLIAKTPSRDDTSRETARLQHLYQRETSFYGELSGAIATRTPGLIHVEHDEDTDDFLLLLEDLTPATVVDQFAGLHPDQAARALEELAGLHAVTAGRTELFAARWLGGVSSALRPLYDAVLPGLFDQFLERYGNQIDAATAATVRRLGDRLGAFSDHTPALTSVVHGDYRSENLLFDAADGAVPVAVVDWQTVSVGSPMLDVAYLLTTSLASDDRLAHEEHLIDHYLEALAARDVTLERTSAHREFARYTLQPIVMLVAASMIVERTERGDAMFLTMIRRAVDAVDHWDAFNEIG